jgi:hypothetical protein
LNIWFVFKVESKRKVVPLYLLYHLRMFHKFWRPGRTPFRILKLSAGENRLNPKLCKARMSVSHLATCACPTLLLYPYLLPLAACVASTLALICCLLAAATSFLHRCFALPYVAFAAVARCLAAALLLLASTLGCAAALQCTAALLCWLGCCTLTLLLSPLAQPPPAHALSFGAATSLL